ncbi:Dehydrogenase reductase SDR member 4 [Aspergillus nanangensis]|uniref:Dehydrogenase reductase SDR member 4 n=1 Tax=Aspergillus nanangensis TaxID=2582783 RepID=A0AAD4CZ31_ASPNN|nr:Dehydrogenase reductase SDR member 4 [Aspergillus nanangensis]
MTVSGKLAGKVAIVTGGGSGFGAGIVKKFVLEGAQVVVADIQQDAVSKTADQYPSTQVVALQADVSSEADWKRVLDLTLKKFGGLDIVVNNAGVVNNACPSIDTDEASLDRLLRVNVKSLYHSTKTTIPYFLENKRPAVFVNVSSISAARPRPGLVWYAASKAALTTASRALAVEWAPHGIRFNIIQPALGETAMAASLNAGPDSPDGRAKALETIPLGRLSTPEDIGNTAAWLASDEATMLTGATIDVDGGRGI